MPMHDLIHIDFTANNIQTVPSHQHAFWEMIYIRVGTGLLHINSEEIPFTPGDIFIVRPGEEHFETSGQGYGNCFCFFNDCFLSGDQPFYRLRDTPEQSVLSIEKLMITEFSGSSPYRESFCASLFETLHQYIRTLLPTASQDLSVEKLRQEIEHHFRDPLYSPTADSSGSTFCSEHMRRLFARAIGMTPLQYLIQLRISYAKSLIADQMKIGLSLKQIAFTCGYNDYYYFSRQFKKQTGFSPREWKNISPYPKDSAKSLPEMD